MTLIDRYIGRQVLLSSAFAVGVLSLVLVLGNIFKKLFELLVNHDVPLDFILTFIGYVLPFSLSFTIPWGFLTSVLLVFGKLSAENELTAFRASGISFTRLCVPVAGLALTFTAICLWINVDVAPRAQEKMRATLYEIATSNPIALFGSDQVIEEFPGHKIYVGHKEGSFLENVIVFKLNENNSPVQVITAKRGRLEMENLEPAQTSSSPEEKRITLRLYDARFEHRDASDPGDPRKISQGITMSEGDLSISLKELYEKNQRRRGLSAMTLSELNSDLSTESDKHLSAVKTEVNKRFSFSLACLAFALIAVPFGITAQRRETSAGFAFSLAIALIYFLFIIIADTFRNNPSAHPELLVWVPNVLFIGLGLFLFFRLSRK
jgi:LPS export ABC transporter permease LptF